MPHEMPHNEKFATGIWKGETARFRSDRLIVSVPNGRDPRPVFDTIKEALSQSVQELKLIHPEDSQWAILEFQPLADAGVLIPQLAANLAEGHALRYAEPDFLCKGHTWPNDQYFGTEQWWARKISINRLWNYTTGDSNVHIAIVDSGISMSAPFHRADHEDFKPERFVVSHKLSGAVVDHNYISGSDYPKDDSGHGTHIAGLIGATAGNTKGVAGANWLSRVYVTKVLNTYDKFPDEGSIGNVLLAVRDCRTYVKLKGSPLLPNPRRLVVNLSLGTTIEAESLRQMCEETATGNILICVAAGSRGASMTQIDFPAAYAASFSHVVAVAATDQTEEITDPILDDYGAITICAPGKEIYSTVPTYDTFHFSAGSPYYGSLSGSSMACAIVSGVASLLWGLNRDLKPGQIRDAIVNKAAKVAVGGGYKHYPRLDFSWVPDRRHQGSLPF
jgi:subtilisin family serine protease